MEKERPTTSTKRKEKKEPERTAILENQPFEAQVSPKPGSEETKNIHESIQGTRSSEVERTFQVYERPREAIKEASFVKLTKRKLTPEQLEFEAELYACIATLNSLIYNFEKGNIDVSTYKRQVQSLIEDIMKSKVKLESTGISMEEFLIEEEIVEQYPFACEKFQLLESPETLESFIESLAVTKADVASGTAEIVTNLITLCDYTKLGGDMARVETLLPLVDELLSLLQKFPTTRKDYWGLDLLREWHKQLSSLPYDAVLTPDRTKRLETDSVRLFNDFKRRLREI
nr:hypothetical protein [Candidatus Njordarchaeota archaeon]